MRRAPVIILCILLVAPVCVISMQRLGMLPGTSSGAGTARLESAISAFEGGDFPLALSIAEELLQQTPDDSQLLMLAGESATKVENFEKALDYYNRVPETDGNAATSRWAAGEILSHLGKATPAVESLLAALRLDPNLVYAHERLIYLYEIFGRRRETRPHLMFLMRANRTKIDDLLLLGNLAKDYAAPEELERFKASDPDDPMPDLGFGRIAFAQGDFERAYQLASSVVLAQPELVEGHVLLGQVLAEIAPDRLDEWNSGLPESAESNPDMWFLRGNWLRSQLPREAVRCFAESIRLAPNHLPAHQAIAQVLKAVGEDQLAKQFAEKAEKIQRANIALEQIYKARTFTPTIQEVAELMFDLGRLWEALGWSSYALTIEPNLSWPRELMAKARTMSLSANMPQTRPEANLVARENWVDRFPFPDFTNEELQAKLEIERPNDGAEVPNDATDSNSNATIKFRDVSDEVQLAFSFNNNRAAAHEGNRIYETTGGGIGIIDFDRDGWQDIYFVQGGPFPTDPASGAHQDVLFRNVPAGNGRTFVSLTDHARLSDFSFGQGVAVGDLNSDGFDDIYVCNIGNNQLWMNAGDGTFWDASDLLEDDDAWTASAAIGDLNLDGQAEIYDANYVAGREVYSKVCFIGGKPRSCGPLVFSPSPDRVLSSDDNGNFRALDIGDSMLSNGLGAVIFKLEGEEFPSVFVSVDQQANLFGRVVSDQGSTTFTLQDEALVQGLAYDNAGRAQACMGIAAGDADQDGDIDLFVTNFFDEYYTLYLQEDGAFYDRTARSGTISHTKPLLGFGTQFIDASLNGREDLVVLNGHIDDHGHMGIQFKMPPQLLTSVGQGNFRLQPAEESGAYFEQQMLGRCLAKLDYDRDGLIDFVSVDLEQPASLVHNESDSVGEPFRLQLVGTRSDRNAVCAIAELTGGDYSQTLQLIGGGGYQASNERVLTFAVPRDAGKLKLTIHWPSGQTDEYVDLQAPSRMLAVEEVGLSELR